MVRHNHAYPDSTYLSLARLIRRPQSNREPRNEVLEDYFAALLIFGLCGCG